MTTFQGSGSGKQWITLEYARFVREFRSRNYQKNLVLLVVTDADELTVARRKTQLARSLAETGQQPRSPSDTIVLWVPRWHIETWHLNLNGRDVDEQTRCKNEFEREIGKCERRVATARFSREYRDFQRDAEVDASQLPSIVEAYREMNAAEISPGR